MGFFKTKSFKESKCPKTVSFWPTRFGSSVSIKRCRFIFCHVSLHLSCRKTARFGLSNARESIKMKACISK